MNRFGLLLTSFFFATLAHALPPKPAEPQVSPLAITGVTIHVGNGDVIDDGIVTFKDGIITGVYRHADAPGLEGYDIVRRDGEHLYPGFVLPNSSVGLAEINSVRGSRDDREAGLLNASVRSIVAYNTDSELLPTFRFNGVLTAQIAPRGNLIAGNSSIVQLDAWNWQDAAIKLDDAMHISWPRLLKAKPDYLRRQVSYEPSDRYTSSVQQLKDLFAEASTVGETDNLNIQAVQQLLTGERQLFIHANGARQLVDAIQFIRQFDVPRPVFVGAKEALKVKQLLLDAEVPILVDFVHGLPATTHGTVDDNYERAVLFKKAGFNIGLGANIRQAPSSDRNLPFIAGTVAAYGMDPEQALQLITESNAQILGIADVLGTIEVGKHATFFTSAGDALEMRTSRLTSCFIQGRTVEINGMQQELYDRFSEKYTD